eukprot:404120-Rhodomonas_salina.3
MPGACTVCNLNAIGAYTPLRNHLLHVAEAFEVNPLAICCVRFEIGVRSYRLDRVVEKRVDLVSATQGVHEAVSDIRCVGSYRPNVTSTFAAAQSGHPDASTLQTHCCDQWRSLEMRHHLVEFSTPLFDCRPRQPTPASVP